MSLFDKLLKRRELQSPDDAPATEWLKEYENYFSQCDQSARPGVAGTRPEDVRAAIVPLLVWGIEPVKNLYSGLSGAFWTSRHIPNVAVRVLGCENSKCNGLSLLLTKPGGGARERCPHCGQEQEGETRFIEYSPRVGGQLQKMFADHSICIYKFERAKALEGDNAQEALALYNEAEAISRDMGNDAVCSMILGHKARFLNFTLHRSSDAVKLAEKALDMARGWKHLHRKEQLVTVTTRILKIVSAAVPNARS